MNAHYGQQKRNLRRRRKALSGLEGLLETVSLEMTESVGTGTHLNSWRERVPNFRSCNAEAEGTKAV